MFDPVTVSAATAVVVIVAGVMYLMETLTHAASAAARIWSVSFLSGILTTFCYLVWSVGVTGTWIAVAIGNAAFVLSIGCLWLGCRHFNERPVRVPEVAVAILTVAVALAAAAAGPAGGDWAGAWSMFIGIAVFAALGAVESRRGVMGRQSVAVPVTAVMVLVMVYYTARTIVFLTMGAEDPLFTIWFGTPMTSLLTITMTIVTVVALSVLRATELTLRGRGASTTLGVTGDGLLDPYSFEAVLAGTMLRAQQSGEGLAVIALRIDDLPRVATAFGAHEAAELVRIWRTGILYSVPLSAVVGEEGPQGVMVAVPVTSAADARTLATRLHQRVIERLSAEGSAVVPVIGVGVALSDTAGFEAAVLIDLANDAARGSAAGLDAAVVVAS